MTPKKEMLARLQKIIEGLADRGYTESAERLRAVCASMRQVGREATIQEVLVRTLGLVVKNDVTLGGRLVDVLAHLAS